MRLKYLLLALFIASGLAQTGRAQNQGNEAEPAPEFPLEIPVWESHTPRDVESEIVVNGITGIYESNGLPITALTEYDLTSVQGLDITRALERVPGVAISRNGGPGSFTAVRVRGAEGEQLLVLLDGVRMADPAAPGGGFDFGNMLPGNLSEIELLRSSNSTIWGSDAIGGVLHATTGDSTVDRSFKLEYGSFDQLYATGRLAFGNHWDSHASVYGGFARSNGFSAAAAGNEPDGFRQTEVGGKGKLELTERLRLAGNFRYAEGELEIDGFPAPNFVLADTPETQETRQLSGAVGLEYRSPSLDLDARYSRADTERDLFDPATGTAPAYATNGTSDRIEARGRLTLGDDWSLQAGTERLWTRFSTTFDAAKQTHSTGAYAQLSYDRIWFVVNAGIRIDEHRDFGSEWSFGADGSVDVAPGLRLHASYGEGFKAPSLFQLHSDFGNPVLQPERSRGADVALEYGSRTDRSFITIGAFRRDTENLIGFVSCFGVTTGICAGRPFGTYDNIGRARAQGLEVEARTQATEGIVLGLAYALLDAEDRTRGSATRGNDLARRPRHALTATVDWWPEDSVKFGADLRVVSDSFDDAGNFTPLGGYEVLTLRVSWDATDHVTLFGRVENLWDETYQTAAGYATPGRGAYIGARARF